MWRQCDVGVTQSSSLTVFNFDFQRALWNAKSLRVTSSFSLPVRLKTKKLLNIKSYPLMSKHSVTTSCWSWGERDGKLRHEMVSRVSRAARGRTVTRPPRRLRQSACKQCAWTADQIFLRLLHCNNCKKTVKKADWLTDARKSAQEEEYFSVRIYCVMKFLFHNLHLWKLWKFSLRERLLFFPFFFLSRRWAYG